MAEQFGLNHEEEVNEEGNESGYDFIQPVRFRNVNDGDHKKWVDIKLKKGDTIHDLKLKIVEETGYDYRYIHIYGSLETLGARKAIQSYMQVRQRNRLHARYDPEGNDNEDDNKFKVRVRFENVFDKAGSRQRVYIMMKKGDTFQDLKHELAKETGYDYRHMFIYTNKKMLEKRKPIYSDKKIDWSGVCSFHALRDPDYARNLDLFLSDEEGNEEEGNEGDASNSD
jgi:hypothetical protein